MLNSTYQKLTAVTTLHHYFETVFGAVKLSKLTIRGAFSLLLALLVVSDNFAIKHLYARFSHQNATRSLNSFYHLLTIIGGKLQLLELVNLK